MEALEIAKELGIQVEVRENVVEYVSPATGKKVSWEKDAANLLAVMRKYRAQRYQESMARALGA